LGLLTSGSGGALGSASLALPWRPLETALEGLFSHLHRGAIEASLQGSPERPWRPPWTALEGPWSPFLTLGHEVTLEGMGMGTLPTTRAGFALRD